jgi:hypothetical protein
MTTSPSRLEIAARIHVLLVRELCQGIDVEQMVHDERYARDVLLVCAAFKGSELAALAQQYRHTVPMPPVPPAGHAARPTDWSRNTSGFGVSRPMESLDQPTDDTVPVQPRRKTDTPEPAEASLARRLLSRWLPR